MKHARADYNRIQDPAKLIPADEPVFLLRGQDQYAAVVIDFYANLIESNKCQSSMVDSARAQANAMRNWKKHKRPDVPT